MTETVATRESIFYHLHEEQSSGSGQRGASASARAVEGTCARREAVREGVGRVQGRQGRQGRAGGGRAGQHSPAPRRAPTAQSGAGPAYDVLKCGRLVSKVD